MDPEQYERARSLFHAAIDLEGSDRVAFLLRECGDDETLRVEVESLLAARRRAAPFLEPGGAEGGQRSLLVGKIVGRCEVVRELAAGGMGTVYEAVQREPRRRVALKVLRASALGGGSLSRFRYEAEILGRLTHPAIARVYEAGTHDDGTGPIAYFTMELVEGAGTLTDHAVAERLTIVQRLALFFRVCEAVAYAHQRGVIHRDLKPSNILVDAHGNPKVLDFGLAKITDEDVARTSMRTQDGQLLGTIAYMSPEQVTGDAAGVDTRCDVYALGVILYELLSGRLPHDVGRKILPEALRTIREDDPVPLGSIDRALRGDLETIVSKALEKEKERRYQSVSELAEDIQRVLKHEPISARPVSAMYAVRRFARRHRALVAGGTATALALIVGLGIAIWQAKTATRARDELALEQQHAQLGEYIAGLAAAEIALRSGDAAEAAVFLDAAPTKLRDWEWWELQGRVDPSERTLTEPTGEVIALAVDPTSTLLVASASGKIHGYDTTSWRRLWVLDCGQKSSPAMAFSADGRSLAAVGADGARMWRLEPGQEPILAGRTSAEADLAAVCFVGDGSSAWITSGSGPIREWRGDQLRPLAWQPPVSVLALSASAGGQVVAVCTAAGLFLLDARGELIESLPDAPGPMIAAAFSRDGRFLAAVGEDRMIRVWALESAHPIRKVAEMRGHTADVSSLAFTPDGTHVLSASLDHSVRIWSPQNETSVAILTGHRAAVRALAALADGRLASASEDRSIKIWNPDALPPRELPGRTAVFAPDGVVYTADHRRSWCWRPGHGVGPGTLPESALPSDASTVLSTPDGRALVAGQHVRGRGAQLDVVDGNVSGPRGTSPPEGEEDDRDMSLSPDGRRMALRTGNGSGQVLDLADGHVVAAWTDPDAPQVHPLFSPDGSHLATLSTGGTVVIRDAGTCVPILVLRGHRSDARCVAFSPDGRLIATGSLDRTACLWDAGTGRPLRVLRGHTAQIESVAFSPSGTRLASGSYDGTVKLWDVSEGRAVATLRSNQPEVTQVRFSPDGSMLLAEDSHDDRGEFPTVTLWHAGSEGRRLALGMLDEFLLPSKVIARLEADPSLRPPVRNEAIAIARSRRPDAAQLNSRAWTVVGASGADQPSCQRALQLAEAACELDPTNGYFLNTLGAAQYRCGQFRQALRTLERANGINGGIPPDMAFIVMCRARLGELSLAEDELRRLRASLSDGWVGGEPASLAQEAESVLDSCSTTHRHGE